MKGVFLAAMLLLFSPTNLYGNEPLWYFLTARDDIRQVGPFKNQVACDNARKVVAAATGWMLITPCFPDE